MPQDYAAAVSWYRKAADHDDVRAQSNLGLMYDKGQGVLQDYAAAARWYREAADKGDPLGQINLGLMYEYGYGVPEDLVRAHMWFNLAAAGENQTAVALRDKMALRMTPAQLAEAQKLAREWLPPNRTLPKLLPITLLPIPPKKPESTGATSATAFFVSTTGTALTNSHVVERCQQVRVSSGAQNGTARVVGRDEMNDLALLATDLHPARVASWRLSVRQGEDIVVYGFSLAGVLASGGNVATGNVTALAGLGNDSRFLQISAPVQQGNSGGPLLDRNGNVVGVVVAKLNAVNLASVTGDIPQNVNFAIKASVAAAFLDAQHVAHTEGAGAAALSIPDIAERANALTAHVTCIR